MNKNMFALAIGALAIAALAAIYFWPVQPKTQPVDQAPVVNLQKTEGLEITMPMANTTVASPLKITGTVSGSGWVPFEAQVGTVKLLDENGTELAMGILTVSEEDWMQLPVSFETEITFSAPAGTKGSLVFKNDNIADLPGNDKTFILPVNF